MDGWTGRYAKCAGYGVYSTGFVACVYAGMLPDAGGVQLLAAFAPIWAITFYCALDARAHQKVFLHSFWVFTFLTWPIAPLFHFVRSRGKRGVLHYLLHGCVLMVVAGTAYALGQLVRSAGHVVR